MHLNDLVLHISIFFLTVMSSFLGNQHVEMNL